MAAGLLTLAVLLSAACTAQAAFPGQNGKLAYVVRDLEFNATLMCTQNPDGSARQCFEWPFNDSVAWSPGGDRLATDGIETVNPDGTGAASVTPGGLDFSPAWSPSGSHLVFDSWGGADQEIYRVKVDGTGRTRLTFVAGDDSSPAWSPDGSRIAFTSEREGDNEIYVMTSDGSAQHRLTSSPGADLDPTWSPDGRWLAFSSRRDGNAEIYKIRADGGDETRLTSNPADDVKPAWAPDGTKIAFVSPGGLFYSVGPDGSGYGFLSSSYYLPQGSFELPDLDWQPLPVNTPSTYPRPKGATPIYAPLVPAYTTCTTPNRQHAPTLSFGSCAPPSHRSPTLTIGVGDGSPAFSRSVGAVRLRALPGVPGGADDADLSIGLSLTNVMRKTDLSDYTGELGLDLSFQLTDHEGAVSQTTQKLPLSATVPCTATASTIDGATCALDTTAEALIPNAVTEGARAIFELGPIKVSDGGADEDAGTPAGDGVLAAQGVFVP